MQSPQRRAQDTVSDQRGLAVAVNTVVTTQLAFLFVNAGEHVELLSAASPEQVEPLLVQRMGSLGEHLPHLSEKQGWPMRAASPCNSGEMALLVKGSPVTLHNNPKQLHLKNQFCVSTTAEFLDLEESSSSSPPSKAKSSLHRLLPVISKPAWIPVATGSPLPNLTVNNNYFY